ncbi:unnamed protein product [Caenorhabditis bovis]|uniref:Uncharacterized protein n=1 Tax=Caenorhabditis bovis TaxID=2654633 RepID=A0A8S1EQD1_9PELO|nr:unnamed protein product [Caenorhabditis bovis]
MTEHALPCLYLNMTGEMMYILEQRLRIQKENLENREKTTKVLKEIVLAILARPTLEEVFRAKGLPSRKSLKMLYEKLAHVSIMRLNENSMDKLFDLITMSTKFAFQQITMAEQLMTVTVNHLQGMQDIVAGDVEVRDAVEHAFTMTFSLYRSLSPHNWHMLRCALLCWFQETRVKISMLLREKRQSKTGNFYLFIDGEPVQLPKDGEPVGTTRYFDNGLVSEQSTFPTYYEYKEFEDMPDTLNVAKRSTTLGTNVYKNAESLRIHGGGGTATEQFREGNEMEFMASIMSSTKTLDLGENDLMGMSLFDNENEENTYVKQTEEMNVMRIDAAAKKKSLSTTVDEKIGRPKTAEKPKKSKGAAMLDLFDEAAARPPTAKPKKRSESSSATTTTTRARSRSGSRPESRAPSAGPRRAGSAKKKSA